MKKNYVYFVCYSPNIEETCIVYISLSRKNCLNFIRDRSLPYRDYIYYTGSKILYCEDDLYIKKRTLDVFRQYG